MGAELGLCSEDVRGANQGDYVGREASSVAGSIRLSRGDNKRDCAPSYGIGLDGASNDSGADAARDESQTTTCYGPVVVGCTMIDMHVSTKIDDHLKVSLARHSRVSWASGALAALEADWPAGWLDSLVKLVDRATRFRVQTGRESQAGEVAGRLGAARGLSLEGVDER